MQVISPDLYKIGLKEKLKEKLEQMQLAVVLNN